MSHAASWKLFIKEWLRQPLKVASIKPSSQALGRAMAAQLSHDNPLVLELGPGTGPLTREILNSGIPRDKLHLIERSDNLYDFIKQKFPDIMTVHGDASKMTELLPDDCIGNYSDVISGLPLLSMPRDVVRSIIQQSFAVMRPGGKFIQFSYGLIPPFGPHHLNLSVYLAARVWDNLPPATVWVYQQK